MRIVLCVVVWRKKLKSFDSRQIGMLSREAAQAGCNKVRDRMLVESRRLQKAAKVYFGGAKWCCSALDPRDVAGLEGKVRRRSRRGCS